MAEIDYQMALLLQHKFEQEAKKPKEYQSDVEIAKALQEQFQTENEIEVPKNGLVYKPTKTLNSSKCLVDPSWEVIDPTPDIHVLFMSFNDRFFWGNLVTVCVSWSKRMTTCAGICSYQGRSGLCSITLSEPLLKLRPRKDLVETLLHEMIHAYLFITNNNRDRDGHGVEFHKHMFRINKEAGTNISVYHDFHDEVRLYKQHWWRCDGPCQKRHPYFGMVRRATNRAPGPNDRWWGEHSRTCGGNFIKVKEPEKPPKKPSKENVKPKEDIRKYMTNTGAPKPSTSTGASTNIHTINNSGGNSAKISAVVPKTNNIFGFVNLNSPKAKSGGTAVKNGSNTIVINKKPSASTKTTSEVKKQVSKSASVSGDTTDYSVVRNHWLNKFPANGVKRTASVDSHVKVDKIPKLNVPVSSENATAECPVCFETISVSRFNEHLDECLEKPKTKQCIICEKQIPLAEYQIHVQKCSDDVFECKDCPVCTEKIVASEYDSHVEKCLLKMYENIENTYCDKNERVDCLTCGKNLLKTELSAHLDDCMGLSQVFEDDDVFDGKENTNNSGGDKDTKFNCPFCMALVSEDAMSLHIDSCLSTTSNSEENELNKNFLVESLLQDDF